MTMDTTAAKSEKLDAQLVSTLREIDPHNYAYLFERCKRCNVNVRHLRFFKKDQIHELIPKSELGILAEFEYLLNLWQISEGYTSLNTKIQLNRDNESNNLISPKDIPQAQSNTIIAKEKPHILSTNHPIVVAKQAIDIAPISINIRGPQIASPAMVANEPDELLTVLDSDEDSKISNAKRMKFDEDDEEQFTLETIVPELLKKLKHSYESKGFLSRKERSLLCSSIVDYFGSRKIRFCSDTMNELAGQIVEHFPKEDKKSWCNRDYSRTRGRFYFRLCYLREKMAKQTSNTSTSKAVTNSTSSEDEGDEEKFTLETIIPELLKAVKGSYISKGFLSANERSFLCSSIVDYFESRKIKFSSNTMDVLAEQIVEHFPTEDKKSWCNRNGDDTSGRFIFRVRYSRRNMAKPTSTNFTPRKTEDDEEKFTLETIIPEVLKELKDSYESKDSLSSIERRLLCSSIVNYFESRKIKFGFDTMAALAEQIVEHFPTEDKKSWCNRDSRSTCGRFVNRIHYLREKMAKQTNNTFTSKAVTNSTSSDNEDDEEKFTLETIIPELLKELKDSYESKDALSINECNFLCSSIVDYFVSRKIKFSSDTMHGLAKQIVEHFPTEDEKSWCNRDGPRTRGRFYFRFHNSRRNMAKHSSNTSTSKAVTNSTSSENEDDEEKFTLETIIPELLKELKDSYESKDALSANERRLLCSSIVDYFESRKIKFSSNIMNELAEQISEHFPKEHKKTWYNRDGPDIRGSFICRLYNSRSRNMAKQTNNTSTSKVTLGTIIPELLKKLKDSYESKNSLSINERNFLCSSIVDYFVSRKIKFSSDTMHELAKQIVEHFPTEDEKSWCNRDGPRTRGRFYFRFHNSRRNMAKHSNNTSTSKVDTNSTSSEDENSKISNAKDMKFDDDKEQFTLEKIIPEILKNLKDSYESKNSLSTYERRFLCSSIVDYFESRQIKFSFNTMAALAEQIVEDFPTEDKKSWYNRDGPNICGSLYRRLRYLRSNICKQTNNTSTSKVVTISALSEDVNSKISEAKRVKLDDDEKFTLETIIPELLNELKDSYESKDFLSANERSFLCSSILDYFECRKIKFSSETMDDLAEQIVEHFPTEDKKSWYNRDGPDIRGSFYCLLYNSRSRNMAKQTNNTSTSKVTLETIIPELLKNLKDSYESKNLLWTNERRFLCSSIVDYFESRKIIFSLDTMDELANQIVEHFPTEDKKSWCNRDGRRAYGSFVYRFCHLRKNKAKQTQNASTSKVGTNSTSSEDEEQFMLEKIIPKFLQNLKDSYELKDFLSEKQRRLLCSSIVDYFESRKIKFSSNAMDELAEQIVEHFPKEDKKSWCNRDGSRTCGRFYFRIHNLRRKMEKQTNNTSTSMVGTNSASSEDEEQFTLEKIIPELLNELKDSYESKNSLSRDERRFLCSSIVDYFESRKIKFSFDTMAALAEQIVEHFPTEDKKSWYNRDGPFARGSLFFRLRYSRRNKGKRTNNTSTSKVVTNSASSEDKEQFTLEKIIPELLNNLKDSYESKNSLSINERRLLCNSIVDYFESRKIKFSLDTMDDLAEQIVQHFPKEDKKAWCDRDGRNACGRFVFRLRNSRRNMDKQTNNTSTSKVVTNFTSREPEPREEVHDEDSKSIQAWLKSHKCENFSVILDLWEDTTKYRCWQAQNLKDLKSLREFLNNWPSYKLETAHELLTMDFRYLYPEALETFCTRWLVYKQNIEQFLKVELKDVNCIKLLEKYQLQKATINEDSSSCILIYLVHAITKPLQHFEAVNAITDSQNSMMRLIRHKSEIDEYTEPYPCIFVVGDSMLKVQECYVVFMDVHYKLSYQNCLAVCVQIFTVLKVEDPPTSQCFWEFIRGYMFNITKDKKFNLATENIVNFLETVASSV